MGQQEYDNFKRLIREWLDSHPDEYVTFVEEMNDKEFKGFVKVFKVATTLVPKYKEATRRRIGDDKISDFEELENVLLDSDLAKKIVNEFHHSKRRSIIPAMLAWLYYGRSYECMVEQGEELAKRKGITRLYKWLVSYMVRFIIKKSISSGMRTKEDWVAFKKQQKAIEGLHAAGVVDPAKVTRVALENAASIAGMFLTTECVIVEKKEDKPEMPMGAPGMGGMGGMM